MFGTSLRIQRSDHLTNDTCDGRSNINGNGLIHSNSENDESEDEQTYEKRARLCSGEYVHA